MKEVAQAWFEGLQDRITADLERLEDEAEGRAPGLRCVRTSWLRGEKQGGGTMARLDGRLFEKAGVHVTTFHGGMSPGVRHHTPSARVGGA